MVIMFDLEPSNTTRSTLWPSTADSTCIYAATDLSSPLTTSLTESVLVLLSDSICAASDFLSSLTASMIENVIVVDDDVVAAGCVHAHECACACVCVRACVRARVCVCV